MRSRRNQTSSVALIVPIVVQRSPKLTLVYVAAMVDVEGVKGGRDTRGHWVGVVTPLAAYHARLDWQPTRPRAPHVCDPAALGALLQLSRTGRCWRRTCSCSTR